MNDYLFYGAMTEPIAPMDKEGNIDYELLKAQVQFQLDHKIHAIFVSVLTECMVTSVDEQIEMLRETVKTVNGQVPVMGNICLNRPEDALSTIKAFEEAGADAVSIAQPHTFTYEEDAIYEYYTNLIRRTKLPVYVYNAPQTNNILSPRLVKRLVEENENVRGYKNSVQDILHLQSVMELIPKERHFECIAGSDSTIFATLALGGCGIISWVSIMFPELIEELCDAYFKGDIEGARALQFRVQKVRTILKHAPMDSGYRYAGELIGLPMGYPRQPMSQATEEQKNYIREELTKMGMI